MTHSTKNAIELKSDPAKLKQLNELFPNDRPTPIEYDACVGHAYDLAIERIETTADAAILYVLRLVKEGAAEILESEYGIKP